MSKTETDAPEEGRPCGLVISRVWREPNRQAGKGFMIKYELRDPTTGRKIGIFGTPGTSALANELQKYLQRNSRR